MRTQEQRLRDAIRSMEGKRVKPIQKRQYLMPGGYAITLRDIHLTLRTPVTTASGNMSSTVCLASSEVQH